MAPTAAVPTKPAQVPDPERSSPTLPTIITRPVRTETIAKARGGKRKRVVDDEDEYEDEDADEDEDDGEDADADEYEDEEERPSKNNKRRKTVPKTDQKKTRKMPDVRKPRCLLCYRIVYTGCDISKRNGAACTKCEIYGLQCYNNATREIYPSDTSQVGMGLFKQQIKFDKCPNCLDNDRPCDRARPCWSCYSANLVCYPEKCARCRDGNHPCQDTRPCLSCSAASRECFPKKCARCVRERLFCQARRPCTSCVAKGVSCTEPRIKKEMNTIPRWPKRQGHEEHGEFEGDVIGVTQPLYFLACGYGEEGIGTARPPDRPDLPGPMQGAVCDTTIKWPAHLKPRPEARNWTPARPAPQDGAGSNQEGSSQPPPPPIPSTPVHVMPTPLCNSDLPLPSDPSRSRPPTPEVPLPPPDDDPPLPPLAPAPRVLGSAPRLPQSHVSSLAPPSTPIAEPAGDRQSQPSSSHGHGFAPFSAGVLASQIQGEEDFDSIEAAPQPGFYPTSINIEALPQSQRHVRNRPVVPERHCHQVIDYDPDVLDRFEQLCRVSPPALRSDNEVARPSSPGPIKWLYSEWDDERAYENINRLTGIAADIPDAHVRGERCQETGQAYQLGEWLHERCVNQSDGRHCAHVDHDQAWAMCRDCDYISRAAVTWRKDIESDEQEGWNEADMMAMRAMICRSCQEAGVTDAEFWQHTGATVFGLAEKPGRVSSSYNGYGGFKGPLRPGTGCECAGKLIGTTLCHSHRSRAILETVQSVKRMREWYCRRGGMNRCPICSGSPCRPASKLSNSKTKKIAWACLGCHHWVVASEKQGKRAIGGCQWLLIDPEVIDPQLRGL